MATKTSKSTRSKIKQGAWYAQLRGSYIPVSWQGWLTYIPYAAYLIYTVIVAFAYTGNTYKAMLWIVPNFVAAIVIMTWLAKRKI